MTTALDAARRYVTVNGLSVTPIPHRGKGPTLKGWSKRRLTVNELPRHFNDGQNIGVLLGEPSRWWVDVDLDCPEALTLARHFLPPTPAVFGRAGKQRSHWLYVSKDATTEQFKDPDGTMLVELRSTGAQTVFPPSIHPTGEAITWSGEEGAPVSEDAVTLRQVVAKLAAASLLVRHWPAQGSRNDTAMALAGALLRAEWSEDDTDEFIVAVAYVAGDEEAASRAKAQATRAKLEAGENVTGWPRLTALMGERAIERLRRWLDVSSGAAEYDKEDLGNARRLVEMHGDDMRYAEQMGWLVWDGTRWTKNSWERTQQYAKSTIEQIKREADAEQDPKKSQRLFNWAIKSQSKHRLNAMTDVARDEPEVWVGHVDRFDADPWLLNVRNGTINLRTGELHAHRREDLNTRLAPVEYDPKATSAAWERFLTEATKGNAELRRFLQLATGYTLTGTTSEEKLFLIYGEGGSGKSTFVDAVKSALGDYAMTADFETFLAKQGGGGIRNDVARLAGARFVSSIEVDRGKKLAEALVKTLTGGDTISARFLYKEFFEYKPQFKLWLVVNHRPRVSDDDTATWRRILVVPFDHAIPRDQQDPAVKRELIDARVSGAAILAWAVEGCLAWQRERRLVVPQVIESATLQYRDEMDPLKDFFEENCEFAPEATVLKLALYESYLDWAKASGIRYPLKRKEFEARLQEVGNVEAKRATGGRWQWKGIAMKSATDEATAQPSSADDEPPY